MTLVCVLNGNNTTQVAKFVKTKKIKGDNVASTREEIDARYYKKHQKHPTAKQLDSWVKRAGKKPGKAKANPKKKDIVSKSADEYNVDLTKIKPGLDKNTLGIGGLTFATGLLVGKSVEDSGMERDSKIIANIAVMGGEVVVNKLLIGQVSSITKTHSLYANGGWIVGVIAGNLLSYITNQPEESFLDSTALKVDEAIDWINEKIGFDLKGLFEQEEEEAITTDEEITTDDSTTEDGGAPGYLGLGNRYENYPSLGASEEEDFPSL